MQDWKEMQRVLEEAAPDVWRLCYPRAYSNLQKWYSPKIPASIFVQALIGGGMMEQISLTGGTLNHLCIALKCLEHKVPTYFVTTKLLRALEQTSPPVDTKWTDLPLPHPGCVFMFEPGALFHPTEGAVSYLSFGRIYTGEILQNPLTGSKHGVKEGGILFGTAMHECPNVPLYDLGMSENSNVLGDLEKASERNTHNISFDTNGDPLAAPMNPGDSEWNKGMAGVVFRILLYMLARPEEISRGECVRPASMKHNKSELWSPTILGSKYQINREPIGTHASPRLHWRRGHFRRQPFGQKRGQTKTIWIEPVMVGES